jgi:Ca2+-binding EF-hand superfamily protein
MPKSFDATREFYLSLFQASAGDQQWLDKKQIEDDIGLQPLAELFDVADRDGDGKLARIELEAFLDLVERGVNCRVCVTLTDRGRNLFDQLDQDGDGRLDRDELLRAAQVLGRPNTLRREDLPRQWRLTAREGAGLKSFGPVALAVAPRGAGKVTAAEARGPRWFQALDRNRRGFLTPRDFLGPLDLFQRLDRDGDGRITVEEADRATGKAP